MSDPDETQATKFGCLTSEGVVDGLVVSTQSELRRFSPLSLPLTPHRNGDAMSKKVLQKDVIVKLIVGAGQASPSPPVGPALGSKGVKSMDFCKVTSLSRPSIQGYRLIR